MSCVLDRVLRQCCLFCSSGKPIPFQEGQSVSGNPSYMCCRRDVARFMIDVTENGEYKRKCMAITSG